jgi:polyhydroxyalkanoate synthesis regulator phasin
MEETYRDRGASDPRTERMTGGPVERSETMAKQFVLAGIGAAATVMDRAQGTFDRFVDRGERVQRELQDRAEDMQRDYGTTSRRSRDYFRSAMTMFLDSLNVPSKADVDVINAKLNILTRKLDNIQMDTVGGTASEAGTTAPSGQPQKGPTQGAATEDDDLAT